MPLMKCLSYLPILHYLYKSMTIGTKKCYESKNGVYTVV